LVVLLLDNVLGLAWTIWLWTFDLCGWATLWDLARVAARVAGLGGGGRGRRRLLAGWDIEDVELAAGGGLDGKFLSGVVGDAVAVHLVVVPVALAGLEGLGLEAESALPGAFLGGVLGEGELTLVAVPGADEVDGLDR